MIGDLYFALRNLAAGMILTITTGSMMYAQQGLGVPQGCTHTDPGTNPGTIGCVTFTYQGQQVTYATVRAKDGNIWLQQNLGSSKTASSLDDEQAYGDLYQWGRWDDGHQLRTSAPVSAPPVNNPNGLQGMDSYIVDSPAWWSSNGANDRWDGAALTDITETVGIDPCKAIGLDWKMPSVADWTNIVSSENISVPTKAFGSNLKLPMGGYRANSNGKFTFVGQRGYFWSSDVSSLGGKYLYVGTIMSNPSAGAPRGQGASVRCMKAVAGLGTSENEWGRHSVEIYPNPTKGILMIKTDSNVESVKVVNTIGQRMDVLLSNNQINMNGLSQGIYWVELKLRNGQTIIKKIMKN